MQNTHKISEKKLNLNIKYFWKLLFDWLIVVRQKLQKLQFNINRKCGFNAMVMVIRCVYIIFHPNSHKSLSTNPFKDYKMLFKFSHNFLKTWIEFNWNFLVFFLKKKELLKLILSYFRQRNVELTTPTKRVEK